MKIYNKNVFIHGLGLSVITFLSLQLILQEGIDFKSIALLSLLFFCSVFLIGLSFNKKTSKKYQAELAASEQKKLESLENKKVVKVIKALDSSGNFSHNISSIFSFFSMILTIFALLLLVLSK